jgi:preprotein translocase subunit SecG
MIILLTFVHVVVCLFLVVVVLLQSGKAADLAGAFGGMGSQTVFGPRGAASALSRATTVAAALFMVTSLSLSIMATRAGHGGSSTLLDKASKQPVPAQKGPAPAQVPVGGSVPLDIKTTVDGKDVGKQQIQAPVVPNPDQPRPPKK